MPFCRSEIKIMLKKNLPFTKQQIESIIESNPTPFPIYDESGIRNNVRKQIKDFSWTPGFKESLRLRCTQSFSDENFKR